MSWIIGTLTFILVLDCLLLILLILVQLPKKEAGLGTAFGSSTTDALFGAGTGNVLTKLTKYCAVIFFAITLSLSVMSAHQSKAKRSSLGEALEKVGQEEGQGALPSPQPSTTNTMVTTNPTAAPLATELTNALKSVTSPATTNVSGPGPATSETPEKPPAPPAPPAETPKPPAGTEPKPAEDPPAAPGQG